MAIQNKLNIINLPLKDANDNASKVKQVQTKLVGSNAFEDNSNAKNNDIILEQTSFQSLLDNSKLNQENPVNNTDSEISNDFISAWSGNLFPQEVITTSAKNPDSHLEKDNVDKGLVNKNIGSPLMIEGELGLTFSNQQFEKPLIENNFLEKSNELFVAVNNNLLKSRLKTQASPLNLPPSLEGEGDLNDGLVLLNKDKLNMNSAELSNKGIVPLAGLLDTKSINNLLVSKGKTNQSSFALNLFKIDSEPANELLPLNKLPEINAHSIMKTEIAGELPHVLNSKNAFAPNLAHRLQWIVKQGLVSAEIMLDPPELGPLHVKITHVNGESNILFQVAHTNTKELLDNNLPKLKEMLLEQGINIGEAQVQHHQSQQDSPDNSEKNSQSNDITASELELDQHSNQIIQLLSSEQLIDIYG